MVSYWLKTPKIEEWKMSEKMGSEKSSDVIYSLNKGGYSLFHAY